MSSIGYYLRPNVQVEPLINRWYAWIQIIPPATCAFNIVERHLRTMESYVQSPGLHAAAVRNPAMRGGPFIDLGGRRVDEVRALLDQCRAAARVQIEFAAAVRKLEILLREKANGYSLQGLYSEIPPTVRGYVELAYDRHHRPDFRFHEALLYRSPVYEESFQTCFLSLIRDDCSRPFIFSTPRLDAPETVELPAPFRSRAYDVLFQCKRRPATLTAIRDRLECEIPAEKERTFAEFFTTDPPAPYPAYEGDRVRIRYFGHACILLETRDVSILLDPVLSYTYESGVSRYTYQDLPDHIDYVLITHSHHDHILMETMLQLRDKVGTVVVPKNIPGALQDPSLKLLLTQLGFRNVCELGELESISFEAGEITGIPFMGEHHDLLITSKICYHVRIGRRTILALADACNISPEVYQAVHRYTGNVDLMFLGMECDGAPVSWVYGPLFAEKPERDRDRSRRGRGSNAAEGLELVERFGCKEVYVYAMGEEPWIRYILDVAYTPESNPIVQSDLLIRTCRENGRHAERLFAEKEIG